MKTCSVLNSVICALALAGVSAETVKDREGAVRADRSKMEGDSHWIYNDWRRGFEEAKATGKPLMVVLRCVPCMSCMGIDAGVLTEPELAPLLDQFVRVRVINANALDLSLFQFDYDLSFSTLFFNGDGTVYGRFGSWTHQKNPQDKDTAGFKRALEGALAIHAGYPANKDSLKGKQPVPAPVKDPLQLPQLAGKYKRELDWEGKVVQSCVHCHQIGDGTRVSFRDQNKKIPREWIYPMPMPETIGLTLAPDRAAHVEKVAPNSTAAKAGIQPGDDLVSLAGQPLLAVADVSWVLHHAPDTGSLGAKVKRGGSEKELSIELPPEWRLHSDISRRVGTWEMRAMATGGLLLEELSPEQRSERGIGEDQMALLVKHAGEYGKHAAAKKAGFRKDDVVVEVDGMTKRTSESELIGRVLEAHGPGEKVKAAVLRGKERVELTLPIQ
jgi:serine protease Do